MEEDKRYYSVSSIKRLIQNHINEYSNKRKHDQSNQVI